jgi:hypothetical protein
MFPHRARIFEPESIERAGMARASAQGWTARLLAAVASLALVLASLLGSAAHACETSHHGQHRHQSHAEQHAHHHAAAANAHPGHGTDSVVAAHGKPNATTSALDHPEPGGPDRQHSCCMDFICHGCIAIVAGDNGAQLVTWQEARILPWDGQALASVSPARLDRPPKALVSA